jgi:hypothetical protein
VLDATQPAVQVVTAGTDWAAIAAGVLGLAGIIGTYWQGKRGREAASTDLKASLAAEAANLLAGIQAEDMRAERAVKQRIYAACQASFLEMIGAVLSQRTMCLQAGPDADMGALKAMVEEPRNAMYDAVSELRLIAPTDVANLATEIQVAFLNFIDDTYRGASQLDPTAPPALADMQERLYIQMRADLGVPADTVSAGISPT